MTPPTFHLDTLPMDEQPHAKALRGNLANLGTYLGRCRSAVALLDHLDTLLFSDPMPDMRRGMFWPEWSMMTCQHASLSIWNFGRCLRSCRKNCIPKCPTLGGIADHRAIRQVENLFDSFFPENAHLRHAVAHAADLHRDEDSIERNALRGVHRRGGVGVDTKGRVLLTQGLSGRCYSMGYEGRLLELEMTGETVAKITRVRDEARRVYGAIDEALARSPSPASHALDSD